LRNVGTLKLPQNAAAAARESGFASPGER